MRTKTARILQLVLLLVAALAPVATLVGGAAEPYGRPHAPFPEVGAYFAKTPGAFDALGNAILGRSALARDANTLRNGVAYHLLHHVDAPNVVSGRQDWLFFRRELGLQNCQLSASRMHAATTRLGAFADLVHASGLELLLSVSPDKSTLYGEMLPDWVNASYPCHARGRAALRAQLAKQVPGYIDHAATLLAMKRAHPERPLYLRTDTHWTPYGGALALRDLARAVRPELQALAMPRTQPEAVTRNTDLRNGMLRLTTQERTLPIDQEVEEAFLRQVPAHTEPVFIAHDSFYESQDAALRRLFPNQARAHLDDMQPNLQPLASARLLVVNTVEREVVPRALSESLSPRSPLYHALLAINAARAEGCEFAEGAASNAAVVRLHDAVRRPGRIVSTGADPFVMFAVPKGEPDDVPCIRVVVESRARAALELFLPYATPNGYGYRPDRLWTLGILPEYSDRVIVLPEYTRGLGFRLDLAADPRVGMAITSVKLGWLRRAAASTMAMVR